MDKYELVLRDLEAILLTIDEVNNVSHGKPISLTAEDTFTSVYIMPTAEAFKQDIVGLSAASYDNLLYIRLIININCVDDPLAWLQTRRKVIDAVLEDTPIWSNIIDRDLVSVAHDEYGDFPKKAMEVLFEFRIRESCII